MSLLCEASYDFVFVFDFDFRTRQAREEREIPPAEDMLPASYYVLKTFALRDYLQDLL